MLIEGRALTRDRVNANILPALQRLDHAWHGSRDLTTPLSSRAIPTPTSPHSPRSSLPDLASRTSLAPVYVAECSLEGNTLYPDPFHLAVTDTTFHVLMDKGETLSVPLHSIVAVRADTRDVLFPHGLPHVEVEYVEAWTARPPGSRIPVERLSVGQRVRKVVVRTSQKGWALADVLRRMVDVAVAREALGAEPFVDEREIVPFLDGARALRRVKEVSDRADILKNLLPLVEWNRSVKAEFWKSLGLYCEMMDAIERSFLAVKRFVDATSDIDMEALSPARRAALDGLERVISGEPISEEECIEHARFLCHAIRFLIAVIFDAEQVDSRRQIFVSGSPHGFQDFFNLLLSGLAVISLLEPSQPSFRSYEVPEPAVSPGIMTDALREEMDEKIRRHLKKSSGMDDDGAKKYVETLRALLDEDLRRKKRGGRKRSDSVGSEGRSRSSSVGSEARNRCESAGSDGRRRAGTKSNGERRSHSVTSGRRSRSSSVTSDRGLERKIDRKGEATAYQAVVPRRRAPRVQIIPAERPVLRDEALVHLLSRPLPLRPRVLVKVDQKGGIEIERKMARGPSLTQITPCLVYVPIWDEPVARPGTWSLLTGPRRRQKKPSEVTDRGINTKSNAKSVESSLQSGLKPRALPPPIETLAMDTSHLSPRRFRGAYPIDAFPSRARNDAHAALRIAALDATQLLSVLHSASSAVPTLNAAVTKRLTDAWNPSVATNLICAALHGPLHPHTDRESDTPPGCSMVAVQRCLRLLEIAGRASKVEEEAAYVLAAPRVRRALDSDSRPIARAIAASVSKFVMQSSHVKVKPAQQRRDMESPNEAFTVY